VFQTSVKGASGTTLQTLGDSYRIIGKYVDITESVASGFCTVTVPTALSAVGGMVLYTVESSDATDPQSLTGFFVWSAVNKAGTVTVAISTETQSVITTAGTLTATASATVSGTTITFKVDAASSLTQTTLRVNAQAAKNFGTGVFAAA